MIAWLGSGDLVLVAAIVGFAACAQMVSGFGFALMAVPMMGLVIDLKTAVVVSTICGTASNTYQAIFDRRHRDDELVRVLLLASAAGMPLGFLVLKHVAVSTLQIAIGALVLVALVAVLRRAPGTKKLASSVDWIAGFLSGILATSTSTNGPPLVLLLRSRGLSPEVFRATINTVFSGVAVLSICLFAIGGRVTSEVLVGAVVAVPGLAVGMALGARLRGALPDKVFWRLVAVVLAATAVSSIASGLL
ncbi:MAG: sulfite exporter TauE/SafE family protein [Actinobacteria bacterium]|nr:sulfite exporter TauE/SafE family protein [Actinomycetota bacterium]NBP53371.1 sulfite exporter TauE/SafE family protein [Actinomycetota bacterium]